MNLNEAMVAFHTYVDPKFDPRIEAIPEDFFDNFVEVFKCDDDLKWDSLLALIKVKIDECRSYDSQCLFRKDVLGDNFSTYTFGWIELKRAKDGWELGMPA